MAINNVNSGLTNQVATNKQIDQQQSRSTQSQPATQAPRQDAVSLTPQAQQLNSLQRRAENNSGVDEQKVERIKQALANGDYAIDAERLAANIVNFEADMFGNGERDL